MAKGKGGFLGQDGLNAPDAPTGVSGTAGDTQVDVSFTSPSDVGGSAITSYLVTDSTKAHTATGSSSPITVTGLTNGTSYTFNVWAINAFGWSVASDATGSVSPALAQALFFGITGYNGIDAVDMSTTGNATDFGDMTQNISSMAAFSSTTKGFTSGGYLSEFLNIIESVSFGSGANTSDFGDLTQARNYPAGASNSTRGLSFGGNSSTPTNTIDYVTMSSSGNASDFGDMTRSCYRSGACANATRAVSFGGAQSANDIIDYVTIASTGNATDFGDLVSSNNGMGGCSSGNTAFSMGGSEQYYYNYFNITTTGNASYENLASDFSITHKNCAAAASGTRALVAGNDGPNSNRISYVTTATKGNASDFGDLTTGRYDIAGCSSAHGGLS
jgi:hypothetical protein